MLFLSQGLSLKRCAFLVAMPNEYDWDSLQFPSENVIAGRLRAGLERRQREAGKNARVSCPFLERKGEYFYYCKVLADEFKKRGVPAEFEDPRMTSEFGAHQGIMELQLWCMQPTDRYEKCIHFIGSAAQ